MARISRFLIAFLLVVLVLATVLVGSGYYIVRRSFPKIDGEVKLPGLTAPVEVVRDAYGIPHVYASNQHDLFFTQGYVHAQDRFWQMDFWRHIGSGRLSEMFGEGQLETDAFLRTLGWARVAQQELEIIDPTSRQILESYSQGVNAYLADHQGAAASLEYAVLGLLTPGYAPEPWQPLHSMTWAKAMAWDLGGNMDTEILRAELMQRLTPEQVEDLFPPYPANHPFIVDGSMQAKQVDKSPAAIGLEMLGALDKAKRQISSLRQLLGPGGPGIGSNSWVISGQLTSTGKPMLANDPHLSAQMPSIWYEIGLHCSQKNDSCPYNVAGYSFAGAPGVIIGHNDRIAWGFTNVGPDVQDLYIEKLNPENPNQYEVNGQWVDMIQVDETIQVAGGAPVPLSVRYTRHGPIISDTYGSLENFAENTQLGLPPSFAVALRWTALDPTHTFTSIWKFNRAASWDEFREAAASFDVPSQNLVYADVDGNIGYQTPGKIPIRADGDGRLPVPGWTDQYEWTGFIPFDEMPFTFNPPQGYVVTANNPVVSPDYPYLLGTDFDYGFRARRIVDMIENAPRPITVEAIQKMQGDNANLHAQPLLSILQNLEFNEPREQQAQTLLSSWDGQNHMDSAEAAVFEVFWRNLLAETFHDDLEEDFWPEGGDQWWVMVDRLVQQPQSDWWDNQKTATEERRDDIFRIAFKAAVAELEERLGNNPDRWKWGDLHTLTFANATLGSDSSPSIIRSLFNRGPFRTSGGASIVNATSWGATNGYEVAWLPSMRMIVDLGNLQSSLAVNTLGQSGHAYHPHYHDMVDLWRNIQYHPMNWDREEFQAEAEGVLKLVP